MKSTGIVRRIDNLGRIVVPVELRRIMDIEINDPVEIFVDNEYVMLEKYQPKCIFCNNCDGIKTFKKKTICDKCIEELKGK